MRQSGFINDSAWQSFTMLLSFYNLRDCVPVLILYIISIYLNYSIGTYSLKYALVRFKFYFAFGFFIYMLHLMLAALEEKLFGKLQNIYEIYMLSCLLIELNNFYFPSKANLELTHPLLEFVFDKINRFIELTFKK